MSIKPLDGKLPNGQTLPEFLVWLAVRLEKSYVFTTKETSDIAHSARNHALICLNGECPGSIPRSPPRGDR